MASEMLDAKLGDIWSKHGLSAASSISEMFDMDLTMSFGTRFSEAGERVRCCAV